MHALVVFNYNPFIAEYYSEKNVLLIVASSADYHESDIIFYSVTLSLSFSLLHTLFHSRNLPCSLQIDKGKVVGTFRLKCPGTINSLRVCKDNLVVTTSLGKIIFGSIIYDSDDSDDSVAAGLEIFEENNGVTRNSITQSPSNPWVVYDTVVSGDVAYTVFLCNQDSEQYPKPPAQQKSQGYFSWVPTFGKSYSPQTSSSPTNSSAESVFFVHKQYLRHGPCAKFYGPFVVDKVIDFICISCDGKRIAFSYDNGVYVALYDIENNSFQLFSRGTRTAKIESLFISEDNRFLTCTSDKGTAHIFDLNNRDSFFKNTDRTLGSILLSYVGYYTYSCTKVQNRVGWKAFITNSLKKHGLELVLISPKCHEQYSFDKSKSTPVCKSCTDY